MSQAVSEQDHTNRLVINDLVGAEVRSDFEDDVRTGLTAQPKRLFPKYFYDALGSQLFEAICLVPEYYLTRAENEILADHAAEIVGQLGHDEVCLLEMGSGSAVKTKQIIEALLERQPRLLYIPVDISASALENSSRVLLQSYPELSIEAYAGDYYEGLAALEARERGRTLALFLGSNIGNFDEAEALTFLRALRRVLSLDDALLLGADLRKDKTTFEDAYDDSLGVTAAFNLNLLVRINNEFDANFDLRAFRHEVAYNEERGRVEVYIASKKAQTASLRKLNLEIRFEEGERIHTENSHKYDLAGLSEMANATGFERKRTWLDKRELFSSNLFLAI